MKEVSGREMLNVGTPRMGKDEAVAPVTDLTDISRVESRRLYRQALKRKKKERERDNSSQNDTEARVETNEKAQNIEMCANHR